MAKKPVVHCNSYELSKKPAVAGDFSPNAYSFSRKSTASGADFRIKGYDLESKIGKAKGSY